MVYFTQKPAQNIRILIFALVSNSKAFLSLRYSHAKLPERKENLQYCYHEIQVFCKPRLDKSDHTKVDKKQVYFQKQFQSQLTEQSMDISRNIWSLNIRLVRTDRDSSFCRQTLADVPKTSAVLLLVLSVQFYHCRHSDSTLPKRS